MTKTSGQSKAVADKLVKALPKAYITAGRKTSMKMANGV
jgi:hypothetical protein